MSPFRSFSQIALFVRNILAVFCRLKSRNNKKLKGPRKKINTTYLHALIHMAIVKPAICEFPTKLRQIQRIQGKIQEREEGRFRSTSPNSFALSQHILSGPLALQSSYAKSHFSISSWVTVSTTAVGKKLSSVIPSGNQKEQVQNFERLNILVFASYINLHAACAWCRKPLFEI